MKILVVDPDVARASALKVALAAARAEVTVASSGSFALTMLEWNRHDIVVSRAGIEDMEGHELCAILKSDPSTRHIRFALVAGAGEVTPAQATAAGVDLVLGPTLSTSALVPLVLRLHQGEAAATPAPAPASPRTISMPSTPPAAPRVAPAATVRTASPTAPRPAPAATPRPATPAARPVAPAAPWSKTTASPAISTPAAAPATPASAPPPAELRSMPSGTFQGSLEVMDLAELTQAIAMGGKSGRLILALPKGGGVIAFETGHVVHAEFHGMIGEPAFAALLTAAHADAAGRFCFLPSAAGEKPATSRTIDKSVDRLLLSVATAIDEKG